MWILSEGIPYIGAHRKMVTGNLRWQTGKKSLSCEEVFCNESKHG